jgi:hypothetical protein
MTEVIDETANIDNDELYDDEPQQTQDLKMDYILKNTQRKMNMDEKCSYIVENVKKGKIIVFEGGLDPKDEVYLIEKSMLQIDHEEFFGIKLYSPIPKRTSPFFKIETKVTIITPSYVDMSCKTI